MFEELETVVLNHNLTKYNLKKGDIAAVVHVYENKQAIEVEVVRANGQTVAVLTLTPQDIRPLDKSEILRVRELATTS